MSEENLNQPDLLVAPTGEIPPADFRPPVENPSFQTSQTQVPSSITNSASPAPTPPPLPSTPAPQPPVEVPVASTPAPVSQPSAQGPPVQPSVASLSPSPSTNIGFINQLLAKAKEKIQFRKRRKLEKIVQMAAFLQAQDKKITNNDVQKLLRVSDATATRYLSQLVKEGRLRRTGHPRDAKYEPAG
jgi:hypothetical protein